MGMSQAVHHDQNSVMERSTSILLHVNCNLCVLNNSMTGIDVSLIGFSQEAIISKLRVHHKQSIMIRIQWWRDLSMCNISIYGAIMLNPIEKFKSSILHLNRDWNHWSWIVNKLLGDKKVEWHLSFPFLTNAYMNIQRLLLFFSLCLHIP